MTEEGKDTKKIYSERDDLLRLVFNYPHPHPLPKKENRNTLLCHNTPTNKF